MFFIFEDGFGEAFLIPPHIEWLSSLSWQSRRTHIIIIRQKVSQITEEVNSFNLAWDRVDNWSYVIKEMKNRLKIRSRSRMMDDYSTTLIELTGRSDWKVCDKSYVVKAVLKANHHITFSRPASLSSIKKNCE